MNDYIKIISRFSRKKILVIGDVILDQYIQGSVSRLSPEAPVPVVLQEKFFYTPGGAANVAHNLKSLNASVTLVGRIGDDAEGLILKKELRKKGVETNGLFVDKDFPTISKTRVIAQHQQVVRIDKEKVSHETSPKARNKFFNFIKNHMDSFDGIIISDYGKGLVTADLVSFVCSLAVEKGKIITVDPKVEHFGFYREVTAITPNLKEAENAIRNIKITSSAPSLLGVHFDKLQKDEEIDLAGNELVKYLDLESLLITMGERGMRLFERGRKIPIRIKTKAREVFDVTGAGDTVIAVFTLSLTAGASKEQAAHISNFAAGVVVGKLGAATVNKEELLAAVEEH